MKILKCFTVEISGFRPIEEAIITSGGVKTSEINPKTWKSKLVSGLYFAGEVIDCDAYTGGFNLQIAWSTGRLAGENTSGQWNEKELEKLLLQIQLMFDSGLDERRKSAFSRRLQWHT